MKIICKNITETTASGVENLKDEENNHFYWRNVNSAK